MTQRLVVLFGSQTFTAQEIAERAWRRSKALGFIGPVQALDEYPIQNLIKEQFAIFVCATTGQGDEPDNMKHFWKFLLRKNLPSSSLKKLKFGVIGLGDSSYAKYNYVGKKLHKRLLQLGATPLMDVGLCDYQHDLGHDAVLGPWLREFWIKLKNFFPDINLDEKNEHDFVPRWNVTLLKTSKNGEENSGKHNNDIYFCRGEKNQFIDYKEIELTDNKRTTSEDHFQDVRLLTFKMADGSSFDYKPGDILNVRPRNSKEDIDELFSIFRAHDIDIEPHYKLAVKECHSDMPVPSFLKEPLTIYEIAEQYWDLNYIPTKYVFSLLSTVSEHKLERNKCLEFCSPEGQEDLLNYCRRPRRTILEVLKDFHRSTSKLTIDKIFELFSPIKPRSFSVASSCKKDEKSIDLLVAVVKYYSKLKKPRLGLCSNWLKDLKRGDKVFAWIKKGSMVFPEKEDTPCILIGPGTGLAPFRSYVLEREAAGAARSESLLLFFGCRYKEKDFHCRQELERLAERGQVTLICAFSRDQEDKIYVQHNIAKHKDTLWPLINDEKAVILISGNSKNMPDSVKKAFVEEVFVKAGGLGNERAQELIRDLEAIGRLQLETW